MGGESLFAQIRIKPAGVASFAETSVRRVQEQRHIRADTLLRIALRKQFLRRNFFILGLFSGKRNYVLPIVCS